MVTSEASLLRQQHLQVLRRELAQDAVFFRNDGVGEGAFVVLEEEDLFFDRVARDKAIREDAAGLTDAVGAIDGLRFGGGVPPWIEQEYILGGGEIETEASGF